MVKRIIDVSEHNGKIVWELMKDKIDGVIIRIGYGDNLTTQDDKYASYNIKECNRLNIPYGLYLYSYADNTTHLHSECEHIERMIKLYNANPTLPIFLDMEESRLEKVSNNLAVEFLEFFKKSKFKVGIYANAYWWKNVLKNGRLDNGYKWVAQYNTMCEINKPYMWQYTNSYKINGKLYDCSYLYGEIETTINNVSRETLSNVSRETIEKYVTKYTNLAKDVIDGKYGNGEDRKKIILSMGRDYEELQAFINDMMK